MKTNETKTFKKLNKSQKNNNVFEWLVLQSKGKEIKVLVDSDKYDELSKYRWYIKNRNYVYTQIDRKTIHLHRLIMNAKSNQIVDHINRNPLDNRVENLRFCTRSQNNMNKSGIRGVSKFRDMWRARIKKGGKELHLGVFNTFDEALKKRQDVEKVMFGEFSNI